MIIEKKRLCDILAVKSRRWVWVTWEEDRIDGERILIGIYSTRREAENDLLKTEVKPLTERRPNMKATIVKVEGNKVWIRTRRNATLSLLDYHPADLKQGEVIEVQRQTNNPYLVYKGKG